jgi:hypothetical protein
MRCIDECASVLRAYSSFDGWLGGSGEPGRPSGVYPGGLQVDPRTRWAAHGQESEDRHGTAWHGMAWHGMAWHGMAWHGVGLIKRRVWPGSS